jgi:hypothetical protein
MLSTRLGNGSRPGHCLRCLEKTDWPQLVGFVIPGFIKVYKSGNVPDENNSTFTLEEAGIDRKLLSRADQIIGAVVLRNCANIPFDLSCIE